MEQFQNLVEALEAAPAERHFVTAWVDEHEHEDVSFGEFRRRARSHAKFLQEYGIRSGDRVVILMPQGIAVMSTFAGAMMLGAVPAILAYPNFKVEPDKYASGLAGVTANLDARAIVIDGEFPEALLGHVSPHDGTMLLRAEECSDLGVEALSPSCELNADSLAFLQHSAGTTGLQKGVALTHRAVLTQIRYLSQALQIDGGRDRVYSWLPLYHDMGLIACFMLPLVSHVPVVMQSPVEWVMHPHTMLRVISDYRCTLAWLPNFVFQFVPRRVRAETLQTYDLSSVRALINCSEPVRAASIDEFSRAFATSGLRPNALQSSYAMAENVFAVSQSDVRRPDSPTRIWADGSRFRAEHLVVAVAEDSPGAICFVSSGRLLPNHRVRIVSEDGANLADGNVGEIMVSSDCLFQGYFHRPDLTDAVLRDGWYSTGDLGFQLDDELYVVGRKKDLLIIGGENLYPEDIEEIAALHPAIHDGRVIAMGIYNPNLGTEDIVVVGEVEREELLDEKEEIASDIRRRIVASLGVAVRTVLLKPPKWIVKSTAGKPARAATREKLLSEHPQLNAESEEATIA